MGKSSQNSSQKQSSQKQFKLKQFIIYSYNLSSLSSIQKQSFSHALHGTGGRDSFLKTVQGLRLGKNTVAVPASQKNNFEKFLNAWHADFKTLTVYIAKKDLQSFEKV